MQSMLKLDRLPIDWVRLAESMGVTAVSARTSKLFHAHLNNAMHEKWPKLIEAEMVQVLQPAVELIRKKRR